MRTAGFVMIGLGLFVFCFVPWLVSVSLIGAGVVAIIFDNNIHFS